MFSCRLFQTRFTLPASRTDKNPVPQFSSHFPLASFYIRSCSTDRSPEGLRRRNCRHHGNIRRKGTPLAATLPAMYFLLSLTVPISLLLIIINLPPQSSFFPLCPPIHRSVPLDAPIPEEGYILLKTDFCNHIFQFLFWDLFFRNYDCLLLCM